MKYLGSNFVTPAGLVILGVLILLAAFLGMTGLEALLTAVLLLSLAAFFWARFSLRKLTVCPEKREIRAFPDEVMEIPMTLKNGKYLPLMYLEATLPLEKGSSVAPERPEETDLTARFAGIRGHQSLQWSYGAGAVGRGVLRLSSITLSSGDGFGLCTARKEHPMEAPLRLIVYPRIHPVTLRPILSRLRETELHRQGYYTDPTLIHSVRDYMPGDSIRDINWRQLARTGSLQVNRREPMRMNRFCLIPDLESFCYKALERQGDVEKVVTKVRTEEMEQMLSLLASIVVAAREQQLLCTMVIPAMDQAPARVILPEARDTQVTELLTALAEIDYHGQAAPVPLRELEERRHLLGKVFLFTRRGHNGALSEDVMVVSMTPGAGVLDGKEFVS